MSGPGNTSRTTSISAARSVRRTVFPADRLETFVLHAGKLASRDPSCRADPEATLHIRLEKSPHNAPARALRPPAAFHLLRRLRAEATRPACIYARSGRLG